jgi:DNA-binding transcriptional LysR family regulator
MRRIIPRLPVWWPPKGHEWVDTLAFDDLPRGRGVRGSEITHYRTARDTVLAGRGYWVVTWSSVRRAVRDSPGGTIPSEPVEEQGAVYVGKERLIPECAVWSGTPATPPDLRARGATATWYRGRACLAGSAIDSLVVAR